MPDKEVARTLTVYTAGWTAEAPGELGTLSNLRSFIAKGPRGLGIGLATLEVRVGDLIWETEGLLYMAVLRWAHGRYKVVGKALFFLADGTLVTPQLRNIWAEQERGKEKFVDERMDVELDILDLHRFTC